MFLPLRYCKSRSFLSTPESLMAHVRDRESVAHSNFPFGWCNCCSLKEIKSGRASHTKGSLTAKLLYRSTAYHCLCCGSLPSRHEQPKGSVVGCTFRCVIWLGRPGKRSSLNILKYKPNKFLPWSLPCTCPAVGRTASSATTRGDSMTALDTVTRFFISTWGCSSMKRPHPLQKVLLVTRDDPRWSKLSWG